MNDDPKEDFVQLLESQEAPELHGPHSERVWIKRVDGNLYFRVEHYAGEDSGGLSWRGKWMSPHRWTPCQEALPSSRDRFLARA